MIASPIMPPPMKPSFTLSLLPEDRPADTYVRGALLHRDLEVIAHAHREIAQAERTRRLPQTAEDRARTLRTRGLRRDGHQASHIQIGDQRDRFARLRQIIESETI